MEYSHVHVFVFVENVTKLWQEGDSAYDEESLKNHQFVMHI